MIVGSELAAVKNITDIKPELAVSIPLVSVIIPCYNQGVYLHEAIESVCRQNYFRIEIIVIDDGSTDETKKIAQRYPEVKYFFQENSGLSAARNRGIKESQGDYLVFLDADDLLLPDAIAYNVKQMQIHPAVAFVSGAYDVISTNRQILSDKAEAVTSEHYIQLLKSNYIGMHATVMYRRNIIKQFQFDTSLKACEDYDLYLKIARRHPVLHHTKKMAAYRMHKSNMSGNIPLMLETSLEVLQRQESFLKNNREKTAMQEGCDGYKDYYINQLFANIQTSNEKASQIALDTIKKYKPVLYWRACLKQFFYRKKQIRKLIPAILLKSLHRTGLYKNYQPSPGNVSWGDLNRSEPLSKTFGFDRGGAIDRYYIENFLSVQSPYIKGRVLEVGDNEYTFRFGQNNVTQSDILHIDETNSRATIIADLSNAPQINDANFDCIILTQTLHLVYDYKAVVQTCHRILKPGGILLLTVPGITPIDYGEWGKNWLWSFTEQSILKILAESFAADDTEVKTFGNVQVATAFLYGLGLPEISKELLDYSDSHYPVIITAKAVKRADNEYA